MDRRLFIHIQGGRQVSGVLRGYDMFLNLVVDQAYEELGGGERKPAGMVVRIYPLASGREGSAHGDSCCCRESKLTPQVIRGNSVASMELLDSMRQ